MDLSKKDLQAIKGIVETVVDDKIGFATDLLRQEIRTSKTELRQEIKASEKRIKDEIISSVGDMIDGQVVPQIDEHEKEIARHDKRLIKLETKQKTKV